MNLTFPFVYDFREKFTFNLHTNYHTYQEIAVLENKTFEAEQTLTCLLRMGIVYKILLEQFFILIMCYEGHNFKTNETICQRLCHHF